MANELDRWLFDIHTLLEQLANAENWVSAIAPMGDAIDGWCGEQDMPRTRAAVLLEQLRLLKFPASSSPTQEEPNR